ncbi:MAG: hypothetical protein QM767_01715 [Anaeromyxobacter sp.]
MNWLKPRCRSASWITLHHGTDADAAWAAALPGSPSARGVIDSTPAAMTTSCVPDMTACAANWIACCDEPHWRSIVTAGTLSGSFEASTALRPICDSSARRPG